MTDEKDFDVDREEIKDALEDVVEDVLEDGKLDVKGKKALIRLAIVAIIAFVTYLGATLL